MEPNQQPQPQTTTDYVEDEVNRRTLSMKSNAWLLWFFLGGVNAHLAYLYPKNRAMILSISIVALVLTFGLSGLFWLFSWIWLVQGGTWAQYRQHVRDEVEQDVLRRRQLYWS